MILDIQFVESKQSFDCQFGEVHNISDGGYERGYAAGYEKGEETGLLKGYADGQENGYATGYAEGLAARTYEIWTITYSDGTVEEKEVALL